MLIEKYSPLYHKTIHGISDLAMQELMAYDWPGNVRELENLVERSVLLAPSGGQIEVEHLFPGMAPVTALGAVIDRQGKVGNADEARKDKLYDSLLDEGFDLQAHEARLLQLAVLRANGNLTHAARLLGITRRQLAYRVKQVLGDIE
ncbi:helix-turn-helix domain-containing protein [Pseudomonas sp. RTC3]|uniref:helix-turn-helix domain-containing protein n=1 Tax=Pseudomonas sp. 5C2 TaxID=3048588 RepID=UPI002AB5256D|nr:helix-turn-helix domain-containing protein [Pseudomonas sp. 5C2]MDY7564648.1 helix-turn-helix domain-containing protein [Pseudomonas sp. 5C2]MEB0060706.1 helix-turn-helix domain-containing protein [Pseudomonas sp. RTC3]MEB0240835.1 helix-turn-helix domain-containing protein [Pseudomonas sp. 5C2]